MDQRCASQNTHLQDNPRRRGAKRRASEYPGHMDIYRESSGRVMMMGRCSVSLIVPAPAPFRTGGATTLSLLLHPLPGAEIGFLPISSVALHFILSYSVTKLLNIRGCVAVTMPSPRPAILSSRRPHTLLPVCSFPAVEMFQTLHSMFGGHTFSQSSYSRTKTELPSHDAGTACRGVLYSPSRVSKYRSFSPTNAAILDSSFQSSIARTTSIVLFTASQGSP